MSRPWQDVVHDMEPATISASVIAKELEALRRPRMASYVRNIGGLIDRANSEVERWKRLYREKSERLEAYEPTPPMELPRHYKPSPESSD